MVNILVLIFCVLAVLVIVFILFLYFEQLRKRKEHREYTIELMERLQLKVFLLKTDLADFAERNNLLQSDFFYNFSFSDCIASVTRVESKCTDPGLLSTLRSPKREKQVDAILADCKVWMLQIDRISSSLETKSRNPAFNKELLVLM